MEDVFKQLIINQFQASLSTLAHCVQQCPDALWNQPVAKYPFSLVVFHTLFFTDFYLETDPEGFPCQPFHLANPKMFDDYEQLEDREPTALYEKSQIRSYLQFCRDKVVTAIGNETEESLAALTKFPRRTFTRSELHVYNIRHIQHHAAQLILRLRLDTEVDVPWIGSGWREPAL